MKKMFILLLLLALCGQFSIFAANLENVIQSKTALVITWQDEEGKWHASGPIQTTILGLNSEEEALYYVYVDKLDVLKLAGFYQKFTVYSLNRDLIDYEQDCRQVIEGKLLAVNK